MSESALNKFTGNYHSEELDATYKVSLVKGTLTLKFGDQAAVDFNPVSANEFQAVNIRNHRFSRFLANLMTPD